MPENSELGDQDILWEMTGKREGLVASPTKRPQVGNMSPLTVEGQKEKRRSENSFLL